MTVTYRDATIDDADALSSLGRRTFVATFGHLYAPEDLDHFLANHDPEKWETELVDPAFAIRLAEDEGHAVGYCKIGPAALPFTPPAGAIELRQLYLMESWKGAGYSDILMNWAMEQGKARGASEIYLSVFTDNDRARAFYARHGFSEVGPYKFMVGNHADDDIVMKRKL